MKRKVWYGSGDVEARAVATEPMVSDGLAVSAKVVTTFVCKRVVVEMRWWARHAKTIAG